MSWKNWPLWLKGGIIFGIIFLLVLGTAVYLDKKNNGTAHPGAIIIPLMPSIWLVSLLDTNGNPESLIMIIASLFSLAVYFVIGAVIGWIYSKSKKVTN